MTFMPRFDQVPSPTSPRGDLLDHEAECRNALAPLVDGLLDCVETAGWDRRTAATSVMFLAAAHSAAAELRGRRQ